MAIGLLASVRNSMLNQIRNAIDGGPAAGNLKFYTAPRPATCAAPGAAVLLATLPLTDPCAPDAAGGVLTFSAVTNDTSADATGTCTWARMEDSTGAAVADFAVTATGGGGDVTINNVNIQISTIVSVTSATMTAGNP